MAIRAVDQINQSLQRNLKVIDLFSHPTVANLARHLEESAPAGDTSLNRIYLEPLHSGHLGTHLVIVGATVRAAADDFPQGMPIWWLKLDGLHVLPHRDLDIPSQAAAYVKELTDAIPQGTLLLCGHSYGGLLAIEIAHQLKDARQYQVQLVLLDPSPAWCKSESFMKRLARSARALRKPNRIGRIQHFIQACSDKITHRVLKPFATRQHKQVTHVESNENFRRMVPYFLQNIRLYQFPQPFSNEIHLIGTPDYLKTCVKELRSTLSGTITVHPVQEHFSHLDIAKPENSHLWVEIVNSLIAENKPAHSRAASV